MAQSFASFVGSWLPGVRVLGCVLLLAVAAQASAGQESGPPAAKPAPHVYFEAEEFFSLHPVRDSLAGFFGTGYRPVTGQAADVLDKTVFLFGAPGGHGYDVWVRAYADDGHDRRVAMEWIGESLSVRFEPTHAGRGQGFQWQKAGTLKPEQAKRRACYQLRLLPVQESRPLVDAVLLTRNPDLSPSEETRPSEDARFTGGDGEGSTSINRDSVTVNTIPRLRVVYTVGPSGIATGGALRFFLPESWSAPQADDPEEPGYVMARASREVVDLSIVCHEPGRGAYAYSHELRHQHECFVRVREGSLKSGDTVTIAYEGRVQPYVQAPADFRNQARAWYSPALPLGVWTDSDGDGVFWPVPEERSHELEVVADEPADFHVVCPSVVRTGEKFTVKVAAIDRHRNPTPAYRGRLDFDLINLDTGGTLPGRLPSDARIEADDHGWRHFENAGAIASPGVYAVRVRDVPRGLNARSNAVRVTADEPDYRVFWGDLHTHHRRCDGLRTFAQAALHARDVAGCDVLALSPHACYITEGDLAELWRIDRRFNEPGSFVPIFACEWAAAGRGAGHSVIYSRRPIPLCFRAWGGGNVVRGRPAFYEELKRHELDVVEVPHHVRGVCDRDPRYQKAIEIYSQWGVHESGVVANLEDGLKACFFGASDNHTGYPGLMQATCNRWHRNWHAGGLTAFLAPRLERGKLFDAIDARRCYATAAERILAEFGVNDHPMGSEFTLSDAGTPRSVTLRAFSSEPITKVVLNRNGRPIRTWEPRTCTFREEYLDARPYGGPTDYYHVRIEAGDERKAWLTPVWVNYERTIPDPAEERRRQARRALEDMQNLAAGRPVTVSFPDSITAGRPELVTDRKLDRHLGHGAAGRAWAQVDLGEVRSIGALRVWHYYRDGRSYRGNRIALSPTGEFAGEETVVFDSEREGSYRETADGRAFLCETPVQARYIRNWLDGNTANRSSQWVELQVFGPLDL